MTQISGGRGMFNLYKIYFSRGGDLLVGKLYLHVIAISVFSYASIVIFNIDGNIRLFIEAVNSIIVVLIIVPALIKDMMNSTIAINKWLNKVTGELNFREKEFPFTLLNSLLKGYYNSPNEKGLSAISHFFVKFDDYELNNVIIEIHYHRRKGDDIFSCVPGMASI